MYSMTPHQQRQLELIGRLKEQAATGAISFSIVSPVSDYGSDPRICLTSVHFPRPDFTDTIMSQIIAPLRKLEPSYFYYPQKSLHMTIKNVRVISDPPHFNATGVEAARNVFSAVVPQHRRFRVFLSRLLVFPGNLSLVGVTDSELDGLVLDLDRGLRQASIPDDKVYLNDRYFFANMTLARFSTPPSEAFREAVSRLESSVVFPPYEVDSVTLLSGNAVFSHPTIWGTWFLSG